MAVTEIPHVPRRALSPIRSQLKHVGGALILKHLLHLPCNDTQLAHLAAVAVLVGRDAPGRKSDSWSTEEMDAQRSVVQQLEAAYRSFLHASGHRDVERSASGAAMHLAFREMEEAVKCGLVIPYGEELIVKVAHTLLGLNFASTRDVEAKVQALLSGARSNLGRMSSVAEDADSCMTACRRKIFAPLPATDFSSNSIANSALLLDSMFSSNVCTLPSVVRSKSLPRSRC